MSTAVNWVRRFRETGSVASGRIGGHKPRILSGANRTWLLERTASGDFTLRGLVVELAERGVKVDVAPLRGWAPRGRRLHAKVPYGHWKTMTFRRAAQRPHRRRSA